MNHVTQIALTSLLASTLCGQQPAARGTKLTLPAGPCDMAMLVGMTSQAHKAPIQLDASTDGRLHGTVVLQVERQLDPEVFSEVATTMMLEHGLLLIPARHGRRVATIEKVYELQLAVARKPAEILAKANGIEFVSTTVPVEADQVAIRINALRPLLGQAVAAGDLLIFEEDGGINLTGTSDQVRFALRLLQALDRRTPAAAHRIVWPNREAIVWPGGTMSTRALVQRFAEALDVLVIGDYGDADLDLGESAPLAPADWYARATQVLYQGHQVLVPVHAAQRVFTLRSLHDARSRDIPWHADYEPSDQIDSSEAVDAVMTTVTMQNISAASAFQKLAPKLVNIRHTSIVMVDEHTFLLCGLRPRVGEFVELLLQADSI